VKEEDLNMKGRRKESLFQGRQHIMDGKFLWSAKGSWITQELRRITFTKI